MSTEVSSPAARETRDILQRKQLLCRRDPNACGREIIPPDTSNDKRDSDRCSLERLRKKKSDACDV